MKLLSKLFLAVLLLTVASVSWAVCRVSEKEIDGVCVHITPRILPGTSFKRRDTVPSKFIPLNVQQAIIHYFKDRKLNDIEGIWINAATGQDIVIVKTNFTSSALIGGGLGNHSHRGGLDYERTGKYGSFDYVGLTVSGLVSEKELWSLNATSSPTYFRVQTPRGGNSLFILTDRSTISLKGKPYLLRTYPKDNSNLSGSGTSNSQLGEDIGGFFGFSSNISAMAELCPSIAFNQTAVKRAYARWTVRNQDLVTHVVLLLFREGAKDNKLPAEMQEWMVTNSLEIKQGLWAEMKKDKSKWKTICEKFPDNLNSGSMDFNQFLPEIAYRLRVEPLGN